MGAAGPVNIQKIASMEGTAERQHTAARPTNSSVCQTCRLPLQLSAVCAAPIPSRQAAAISYSRLCLCSQCPSPSSSPSTMAAVVAASYNNGVFLAPLEALPAMLMLYATVYNVVLCVVTSLRANTSRLCISFRSLTAAGFHLISYGRCDIPTGYGRK